MNIIRKTIRIATIILSLAISNAHAADKPVSAFGFALGAASKAEALNRGGTRSGTNKYSGGPMVKMPASALGVDGVESATLIYNRDGTLAALMVMMQKSRFDSVYNHLANKYALREQKRPFVGNKYARFGAPGATIELDAPHLSFSMSLMYQQDSFVAAYERIKREEAARKRSHESRQF